MPILREGELDIVSHSIEQTQRLGLRLGALLEPGHFICLSGDMGAGKTMFAVGIGRGWGAVTPLTSPTFTLIHEHRRQQDKSPLFHLDCYRLEDIGEVDYIGFDDVLEQRGPVIVEWPEHIEGVVPEERLWVDLRIMEPTRRNFIFNATGEHHEKLLAEFRKTVFGQ